jgi:LuxR family transcriptional regulator, maltose regulon positive regulatory protein
VTGPPNLDQHQRHTRVGWLSLDDGDNDLTRFIAHLVAAFQSADLDVDAAVLDSLSGASATVALTSLVNDLAQAGDKESGRQWIVVLDDYHVIRASEVHEAVTFLLDHLPDHVHLVVATRSDPPLPLARLRSRGQLCEVRAAELRFTPSEAREFLTQAMELELAADDVDALQDRTEGWIAGLQLAALSLRGIADPDEVAGFISAFTGSNRLVIDYLADEVLARQPPRVRNFMHRTAILDRLHGPLCDAVTGGTDGTQTLEHLERENLFVVPLDTERSWYRVPPPIRRRAPRTFARRAPRTGAGAPSAGQRLARRSRSGRGRGAAGARRRGLRSCSFPNGGSAARVAPRQARRPTDGLDGFVAGAGIPVYRAALAQARGDVAGTVRHARHVLELAGPDDHFQRGAADGYLGLAAWASGDVHEALSTFSDAVRSLHAAGNFVDELDMTIVLADVTTRTAAVRRAHERGIL